MNTKKTYRRYRGLLTGLGLAGLAVFGWAGVRGQIPDQLQVDQDGEIPELSCGLPKGWVVSERSGTAARSSSRAEDDDQDSSEIAIEAADQNAQADFSGSSGEEETAGYAVSYSLFGTIPLKTVSVSVQESESVYVCGTPIGIYLETDGVFVVDTGTVETENGDTCCPAEHIVQSGDYILAVNGEAVDTKEELIACISKSGGEALTLNVNRQGEELSLSVIPVKDSDGIYRAGIWVRNDTQGIGTLTYVDEDGNFGALGHGISDTDTGLLLNIRSGVLYSAQVLSVIRGTEGAPGELAGVIHYSDGYRIGSIRENRVNGIYGSIVSFPSVIQDKTLVETALRQEVETGPATIRCTVDGSCREYEAEILEVRLNGKDVNKGMVIEVTDPELLALTGGIVQGMSGSPILQNGKLVGAVTHVFVNNPAKGYGIFIENMLKEE